VKIVGTFALMVVCGVIAFLTAVSFLMNLGLKLHDSYEYYGSFPSVLFVFAFGLLGFVSPGLLVWWLERNRWKFGLREVLFAITAIAILLGGYSLSL
jgi:hypothetical protein